MYPNLYFFFKQVFGLEINPLKIVNTFGFFMALAFGVAAYILAKELKRKENENKIPYTIKEEKVGTKPSLQNLLPTILMAFFFGWKMIGAMLNVESFTHDMGGFIFSMNGNLLAGLVLAALAGYDKYRSLKKNELPQEETKKVAVYPSDRIGDFIMVAAITGFAGAKIFNALETWDDFLADPIGSLFSGSGLTFFGALICGGLGMYWFTKKLKIIFLRFADAVAPAMIMAYAVGRIGCMVAGDGDWGIYNSAYKYDTSTNTTILALPTDFPNTKQKYPQFFQSREGKDNFNDFKYFKKPAVLGFLPNAFFAYTFPNNVNSEGIPIENCHEEKYCNRLPWPVFPTPIYETIMGLLIFGVLWSIRKKYTQDGKLFGLYLILIGVERFLIELIRVNTVYDFGFVYPTQAELISLLCVMFGLYFYFRKSKLQVQ